MTRPSVLRIITRLNIGGPARHATLLSRGLEDEGFRSELVSGSETAREGRIEPIGITYRSIPSLKRAIDPVADLRTEVSLSRLIRDRRPDIVHTHLAKAGALGRLAARRAGVPVIIHTFHGHVLEGYFPRPVARAFVEAERRLARISDALLAISPLIRDQLLELRIGTPSQWHVIPLGLELDDLLTSTLSGDAARLRLGLLREGPLVGIVGRLVPIKNHNLFLDAAVRVASRRPDARFVVAGDGELRPEIESKAHRVLGNRVQFLGWITDLPALYASLDVVVLTSRNEGTPVVLIEAGAASRPVIATSVGGVPDVVIDGETGFLVAAGDSEAVADRIVRSIANPERAGRMGRAGSAFVRERFSADRLVAETASLYRQLLARLRA